MPMFWNASVLLYIFCIFIVANLTSKNDAKGPWLSVHIVFLRLHAITPRLNFSSRLSTTSDLSPGWLGATCGYCW